MKRDPVRMVNDLGTAPVLRQDLSRIQGATPNYDEQQGLRRFHAMLVSTGAIPGGPDGSAGGGIEGLGAPVQIPGAPVVSTSTVGAGAGAGLALTASSKWVLLGLGTAALTIAVPMVTRDRAPVSEQEAVRVEKPQPVERAAAGAIGSEPATQPRTVSPGLIAPEITNSQEPRLPVPELTLPNLPAHVPAQPLQRKSVDRSNKPDRFDRTSAPAEVETAITDPDEILRREIEQLARARALLDVDPHRALALLDQGTHAFPVGMFGEERAALSIMALDQLGRRQEAVRRARAFLASHGSGPFAERVRQILESNSAQR